MKSEKDTTIQQLNPADLHLRSARVQAADFER